MNTLMIKLWLVKWIVFDPHGNDEPNVVVFTDKAPAFNFMLDKAREKIAGFDINYYIQEATIDTSDVDYHAKLAEIVNLCRDTNDMLHGTGEYSDGGE